MNPTPRHFLTLRSIRCAWLALALLPALAAAAVPAAGGSPRPAWFWGALLLALVLGGVLGRVLGLGDRRDAERLRGQMQTLGHEHQRQGEQLLTAMRERGELLARLDEQSREFERLAHEDPLTGLPNGRAFNEYFAQNFARSKRHGQALSLILLDIDHLKQINESWSHAMGDNVLVEVAKLLRSVCRTSDLPARLWGDTFAVVLTDTDKDGGWQLSQRLHSAFARNRTWYSGEVGPNYVTFSGGLVQQDVQDEAPLQLFQRADRALYLSKHAGGARTNMG